MSSSYHTGWSTEGTPTPTSNSTVTQPGVPSLHPPKRTLRSSRRPRNTSASPVSSPFLDSEEEEAALEDADAAGLAGLAAVGRLLEGKDTFKRRPRERVIAPTQDQSGRPLPEHIMKRNRRRITNRESARRMRDQRKTATQQLRAEVKQLVEANAYMNKQLQETRDTCRQLSDESIEFQKGWDDARLENERISAALKQLTASQTSPSSSCTRDTAPRLPLDLPVSPVTSGMSLGHQMLRPAPQCRPQSQDDAVYMAQVFSLAKQPLPPSQPMPHMPLDCPVGLPPLWDPAPLPGIPPCPMDPLPRLPSLDFTLAAGTLHPSLSLDASLFQHNMF